MFKIFFRKILPFMRKRFKDILEPDTSEVTIWRMRVACWISNTIDTHSEYVILIAFPLQQWLRESATLLNYSYLACLVFFRSFRHYSLLRVE